MSYLTTGQTRQMRQIIPSSIAQSISTRLENQSRTLRLLVTTGNRSALQSTSFGISPNNIPKLEVLAALERQLCLCLALNALQSQDDLLRCLGLLVENGLGLTTVTGLLAVITTLSLRECGGLYSLSQYPAFTILSISQPTLPALYCVTLCWVCFLQVLCLQ